MNCSLTDPANARNVRVDAFVAQMHRAERTALAQAIERETVAELERAAIAGRIKQARNEAGLSQPEMAEALDVIPRTYQNYESQSNPRTPWGLMSQIATITGKTTEWLIHGDRAGTPDLFPVTEQLDEIVVNFSGRVDGVEERLGRIETVFEGLAKEIRDQLASQTRLLEAIQAVIAGLGVPQGVPIEDHLIARLSEGLRDVLIRTAPPEPPARP